MIEAIYTNKQFIDALNDKATTKVAYKFNKETNRVFIISLKSTDGLISKIKYFVARYFFGFNSLDMTVQRELASKKVTHLFNLEKMEETTSKVERLKAEFTSLLEQIAPLADQKRELEAVKKELAESTGQLKTARKQTEKYQKEYNALKNQENSLNESVQNLTAEKSGLEKIIPGLESKVSKLGEEHWEKIRSFLEGSDPAQYLNFLQSRITELGKVTDQFAASCTGIDKYESYEWLTDLKDYRVKVSSILHGLQLGIQNEEKKTELLKILNSIQDKDLCPEEAYYGLRKEIISALNELIELNFRLQQVNQTDGT